MTKKIFPILILIITVILSASVYSAELYGAKGADKASNLTLQQMLTYAIQDEYLAHAEYELIIEKYGLIRPFSNIIKSEETHINMLIPLFKVYGFPVPEDTGAEHAFLPRDLKEAFEMGVQAEIENIAMYERFLDMDLPDDVKVVFERLKNASENHLRAFKNGLRRY